MLKFHFADSIEPTQCISLQNKSISHRPPGTIAPSPLCTGILILYKEHVLYIHTYSHIKKVFCIGKSLGIMAKVALV